MPYKRGLRKPYKKRVNTRRKKTTRKGRQLVTKSQLYRAIRRNVETKMASNSYTYTTFNSGITGSSDFISILPVIANGTNQNNRVGHTIKPLKLVINGYVCYHTDSLAGSTPNQDARMIGARLFCLQDKTNRSYANTPVNFDILDVGGTSSQFSGSAINWVTPHNSDMFQFFADRRMKILKPFGWTNNSSPTSSNAITSFNNTMFHHFKITLTSKHLPGVLKFDDNESANYPVNFAPYLALGYCDLLNKSADTTSTQVAMEFVSTLYYEDA